MHFLLDTELIFCLCWCSKFIITRSHFIVVVPWLCFGFCGINKNNEINGSEHSRANEVMFLGFVFDSLISLPLSHYSSFDHLYWGLCSTPLDFPLSNLLSCLSSLQISAVQRTLYALSSSELLLHWHAGRILADWVARGQSKKVTAELSLMFYS